MKNKHNKKRNTAFLYEVLVKELTKAIVAKDSSKKVEIAKALKTYFGKSTLMYEELKIYKSLMEDGLSKELSEKIVTEAKSCKEKLDRKSLFNEQTKLISYINSNLGHDVYSNFVPNYKSMANIYQFLNSELGIKDKVLLEQNLISNLQARKEEKQELQTIDNLVFKTFIEKFNKEYNDNLLEEQKKLVTNYVFSFSDNSTSFKVFLNEELERLTVEVKSSLKLDDVKNDQDMVEKTNEVISFLESFKNKETISEQDVKKLMKIQMLVGEVSKDGN